MYSNSGSNRVQVDSSFKPKGVRIQFDPVKLLEMKKSEILFRFTTEIGCSNDEATAKFDSIVDIINYLKPLRLCKSQTYDYLEETIKPMPYILKSKTVYFLMQAIRGNITWCHAWNCLAYHASRDLINPVKNINLPEHKLLELLEQENENDNPVSEDHSVNQGPKVKKSFPNYLLHENRDALAEMLKTEFSTEKGKGIRLMLEAMLAYEPPLITIENRERTNIYNALKAFFDRDIGSKQSIFDYQFDLKTDQKDFDAIQTRLDFIIKSL